MSKQIEFKIGLENSFDKSNGNYDTVNIQSISFNPDLNDDDWNDTVTVNYTLIKNHGYDNYVILRKGKGLKLFLVKYRKYSFDKIATYVPEPYLSKLKECWDSDAPAITISNLTEMFAK